MISVFINNTKVNYLELNVTKHLDDLAGAFNLGTLKSFSPGDKIVIKIGNQSLVDGFVDISKSLLNSKGKSFHLSGRDKTGDLVDSCVTIVTHFKDQNLTDIAKRLVSGFNIKVSGPNTPVSYKSESGQTVFKSLIALGIKKSLRVVSRAGSVSFERISPESAPFFSF